MTYCGKLFPEDYLWIVIPSLVLSFCWHSSHILGTLTACIEDASLQFVTRRLSTLSSHSHTDHQNMRSLLGSHDWIQCFAFWIQGWRFRVGLVVLIFHYTFLHPFNITLTHVLRRISFSSLFARFGVWREQVLGLRTNLGVRTDVEWAPRFPKRKHGIGTSSFNIL